MGGGHIPVLPAEVCEALGPALHPDRGGARVFVDATCGLGGHSALVVHQYRPSVAVLLDRDPHALARARARLADAPCPVHFVPAPFSSLPEQLDALGIDGVAAVLADLGVSSMQLDQASRGFSWRGDAPLDMRMDPSTGETAADLVRRLEASELARLLREYGEEPDAFRIAQAIAAAKPATTTALADVVAQAMSAPQRRKLGKRIHPATRTFQALRIAVNAEMQELDRLLDAAPLRLEPGGRLAIITFHSLEDRRVKQRFRRWSEPPSVPAGVPLPASALPTAGWCIPPAWARGKTASDREIEDNPRSRSARLRVLERSQA